MQHSTGRPTQAQERRFYCIKQIGCIACCSQRALRVEAEVHHLLSGNRRRGHDFTIGLCTWHHRGVTHEGERWNQEAMRYCFGPSLALESKAFHDRYGSDDVLLHTQNALIVQFEQQAGRAA